MKDFILKQFTIENLKQLFRYGLNCGFILSIKLGFAWLLIQRMNPNLAYFFTLILVFFCSYFLHVRYTFKKDYTFDNLKDYFRVLIVFKVIDYIIFSVAFVYFQINAMLAILLATIIIFVFRFIFVRKAIVKTVQEK